MSRLNFVAIAMKMTSANKTKHEVAKINTLVSFPNTRFVFMNDRNIDIIVAVALLMTFFGVSAFMYVTGH